MECIFCKIVNNEVPNIRIYEDSDLVAVLDIFPANPGQVLIIPKKHVERFEELPDGIISKMFVLAKYIAISLKALKISDYNIILSSGANAGQRVPHIALFIIPRVPNDKVVIEWERKQMDIENLKKIGEIIKNTLGSLSLSEKKKEEKKVIRKNEKKKEYKNVFKFLP